MGWSSYRDMNAEQAIRFELRGCEIIAKTGAWWLVRVASPSGHVTLVHALTERSNGETFVKLVDASVGPVATPPKTIFRRWLKESAGQERGHYEEDFIQRVEQEHNAADEINALKAGDEFSFGREIKFTDGTKESTFIYEGKFRARRKGDGALIRLPRNFRKRITLAVTT